VGIGPPAHSFQSKEFDMLKIELRNQDTGSDPPACFATDADIEIANLLRRQIEERYLATSAASPLMQVDSSKGH
jgi:hypothetical protein